MMTQNDKDILKKVSSEFSEIHDQYTDLLQKEDVEIFNSTIEWIDRVIEDKEILQELDIQNNSILVYDIDNYFHENMINKNSLFARVFSMTALLKYNVEDKKIILLTTKPWYRSKYNGLLIQGWVGLIEVLSEGFKESFDFSLIDNEINKCLLIKRMINYLLMVGYINNQQANNYLVETIGNNSRSLRKIEDLKNAIFYIKMAERIYNSRDYIYYSAFVKSSELLQDFQKFASEISEKFHKLNWLQRKLITLERNYIHNFRLKLHIDKIVSVATSNAIHHYWGTNVDIETKKFMEENNIEDSNV